MRWLPVTGSRCEAGMCISGRHGWHLIPIRRNFTCPHISMQSSLHKRGQRDRRRAATSAAEEGGMVLGPYEQLFTQPTLKDVTYPTDLLCASEVLDRMALVQPSHAGDCYLAFYSSELGGITTTPGLMTVAIDDHMVHRGHAVFDTAIVVDGHLYQLRQHFERLLRSAEKARIPLPMPREQMWRTILETAAAGQRNNAFVRYWLSAGRGGFGLSSDECKTSSFYVMVYIRPDQVEADQSMVDVTLGRLAERGLSVCTSSIPQKPAMFATMKTNNYLPNALALLEAQDKGLDQGIFVDAEGWISEGPAVNVGIITQSDTLVVPPFETSLDGITIQRLMELIPTFQDSGDLEDFVAGGVERRPVHIDEVFEAKEAFITSSSTVVLPVVRWDDRAINDGEPGEQTLALRGMLEYDMDPANETGQHIPVPYGFLTGMEDEDYVY